MKVVAHTQETIFTELKSEWNELLHRSIADQIFSTWEWNSIWWEVFHPGDLWILTCRDDDDKLLGIAPWFFEVVPGMGKVVRCIGCEDVTDYMDVIVDVQYTEGVFRCFTEYLAGHRAEYDVISLCNIPEASPTLKIFSDTLEARGFEPKIIQEEVCPIIRLNGEWDDYLSHLNKKQRHEVRRKMRRAHGSPQPVDWYIVDETQNLDEQIKMFLELMAASDTEKAGFLTDPDNVTFFKKIIPAVFDKGWLQLNFLTIDGVPTATYLNFVYNNRVLVYNSGLNHEEYGHLSPGIVLLAHNIRYAIEQGYEVFDFLRGDEEYKYRMGGEDTAVFNLSAQ